LDEAAPGFDQVELFVGNTGNEHETKEEEDFYKELLPTSFFFFFLENLILVKFRKQLNFAFLTK
jgi:hypothetical protein